MKTKNASEGSHKGHGVHIRPCLRVTFAPTPARVTFAPTSLIYLLGFNLGGTWGPGFKGGQGGTWGNLSIYVSIFLSIYRSIYLSIYLSGG